MPTRLLCSSILITLYLTLLDKLMIKWFLFSVRLRRKAHLPHNLFTTGYCGITGIHNVLLENTFGWGISFIPYCPVDDSVVYPFNDPALFLITSGNSNQTTSRRPFLSDEVSGRDKRWKSSNLCDEMKCIIVPQHYTTYCEYSHTPRGVCVPPANAGLCQKRGPLYFKNKK